MKMRPEIELLILCVQSDPGLDHGNKIPHLLDGGIDWEFLWRKAQSHGVLSFLYQKFKGHFLDRVPVSFIETLRSHFRTTSLSNLRLMAELLRLIEELEEAHIPVIPLKGPILTHLLYEDLGMRPCSDLDLLFRREDVPIAKVLLRSRGYEAAPILSEAPEAPFHRRDSGGTLVGKDPPIAIDLLWGMPGEFLSPDFRPFWERAIETPLEDRSILTLSMEDQILYLSLHQATHGWNRLLWLCDLDALIRKSPFLDWDGVVGRAEEMGCWRVLGISLLSTQHFLRTPLPEAVRKKIKKDGKVQGLARIAAERLFPEGPRGPRIDAILRFQLAAMDRRRDRVRFCLKQAFQPTVVDWLALPLPRPLFPLYYLFHPLRRGWKMGHRFLKSVRIPEFQRKEIFGSSLEG